MRMAKCIINLETLNRISNIFPCVAWKDHSTKDGQRIRITKGKKTGSESSYFDTNKDFEFHEILNQAVSSGKSDYEIILEFYNFKHTPNLSKSRAEIFKYLLPPEDQFLQIDKSVDFSYLTSKGIYNFFNRFFVEETFNKNLKELISTQLLLGEEFPLYEAYDSSEWICYYNNNGPRFTWDKGIDWKNIAYDPNVPWEGFEHYCQYRFTLVRIGYEKTCLNCDGKNKSIFLKKGLMFIRKQFSAYHSSDDTTNCLYGNIDYGVEHTKTHKDVFYIKNLDDTKLEIKMAIKHKKFQKQTKFEFTKRITNNEKVEYLQDITQIEKFQIQEENNNEIEFTKNVCKNFIEQFSDKEREYKKWLKETFLEKEQGIYNLLKEVELIFQGKEIESSLLLKYLQIYNCDNGFANIVIERFSKAHKEVKEEYDE